MTIWKPVDGFDGYYEVNNLGNVRSVRYNHKGKMIYSRSVKPFVKSNGYLGMVLSKQSYRTNCLIHRLVATAFLDNPSNLPEVNHIDGNKLNNAVSNLEWCSSSDNLHHAYQTGLKSKEGKAVICVETGEVFDSVKDANKAMGVTHYHIADVCNHKHQHKTACDYHWEWLSNI